MTQLAPVASLAGIVAAPFTGGTSLALTAGAVGAAGSLVQGISNYRSGQAQAQIAENNAAVASTNADSAFSVGVEKEQQVRRNSDQQLGAQTAAAGESGFVSNSGSMLDTQVQSAGNAELDALQTRYQGVLQGQAYEDQANNDRYQAKVAKQNASNALISGVIQAGTSALTGYSNFAKLGAGLGGVGSTAGYSSRAILGGLNFG